MCINKNIAMCLFIFVSCSLSAAELPDTGGTQQSMRFVPKNVQLDQEKLNLWSPESNGKSKLGPVDSDDTDRASGHQPDPIIRSGTRKKRIESIHPDAIRVPTIVETAPEIKTYFPQSKKQNTQN